MATPDMATCLTADDGRNELLPLSPFNALHYHFGMLLGVDDFETEQAYHRAKMRLHNAWLHREGVVWGLGVGVDETKGEVSVTAGLALDAAGHELHLDGDACVNVAEWFEKHKDDPDFTITTNGDATTFDAHVVIRFKACLTRQVPSFLEPCDNAGTGTAYSRVFETVEILMLPNEAPLPVYPYHRLRLLFGLDEPKKIEAAEPVENPSRSAAAEQALADEVASDQEVLDEVARIQALPFAEQAAEWLNAFHRFAALDEIDLRPATSEDGARTLLFPGRDNDPVVLANISGLTLTKQNNQTTLSGGTVDTSVRPSHVATTTIQDLLCGTLASGAGSGTSEAIGPRIDSSSVEIADNKIVLQFDQRLQPASVKPDAFSVSVFDTTSGWATFDLNASLDSGLRLVTLEPALPPDSSAVEEEKLNDSTLKDGKRQTARDAGQRPTPFPGEVKPPEFGKGLIRIIARGTGSAPLLGENNLPLAGATNQTGSPQGTDFVLMKERN